MYNAICEALHRELEILEERFSNGTAMNSNDLDMVDKIAHALKSLKTYEAMEGNSEYGSNDSYARGRSRTTGRYVSRDDYSRDSRDNSYRRY